MKNFPQYEHAIPLTGYINSEHQNSDFAHLHDLYVVNIQYVYVAEKKAFYRKE